jgi:hypothetical protein
MTLGGYDAERRSEHWEDARRGGDKWSGELLLSQADVVGKAWWRQPGS